MAFNFLCLFRNSVLDSPELLARKKTLVWWATRDTYALMVPLVSAVV